MVRALHLQFANVKLIPTQYNFNESISMRLQN